MLLRPMCFKKKYGAMICEERFDWTTFSMMMMMMIGGWHFDEGTAKAKNKLAVMSREKVGRESQSCAYSNPILQSAALILCIVI
jgi:hypothetical protein